MKKNLKGSATSVLEAEALIDGDFPILVMDCDIFFESLDFEKVVRFCRNDIAGAIPVFKADSDKWSFSEFDEKERIINKIAEKQKISQYGNVGFYYFSKGAVFVKYAKVIVEQKLKKKNEFYMSTVIEKMISNGWRFYAVLCKKVVNLGTPEDLEEFLKSAGGDEQS